MICIKHAHSATPIHNIFLLLCSPGISFTSGTKVVSIAVAAVMQ